MADTSSYIFRESDKLKGSSNYYVWPLKMKATLRAEGQWNITETEQRPENYPIAIEGEAMTEIQLKRKKTLACRLLLMSVADDVVDLVAEHTDPVVAWKALKDQFNSGDQSQVLTLMSQLQSMRMQEGGSVEDYVKKARELRNRLLNMGERITDKSLNQLVLNGLPRSFESLIQTLTHIDPEMSFEKLSSSLLLEAHRRQHRSQQYVDEEALAVNFHRFTSMRGRGGLWSTQGRGLPSRGVPGMIHQCPPSICFNCNLPSHIARDCKLPRKSYNPYGSEQSKNTAYANSAEIMQPEEYDGFYDYNYYNNGPWYLDSGATSHIAADHHKLEHCQSRLGVEITEVKTGGGESHSVCGTRSAIVNTEDRSIKLKSVKYVPSMRKNLVFVGAIADSSHKVSFSKSHCWITNTQDHVIASGRRDHSNGLYYFRNQIAAFTTYNSETTTL